ncbi:MAG TPA: ABC transporter substrate-binding protein [Stellaceae bacterium]|nr:ABC transporter substrate-binding protein [Stellaceae bacterium]
MRAIGVLSVLSPEASESRLAAFRQALSEAGYVEGQSFAMDYRWAEGNYGQLSAFATELVGRKVDLIVTGGPPAARAAKDATSTIPVVFVTGADPVAAGLVVSLARPGGNLTGIAILAGELAPKRLELLAELVPTAKTIALLINPNNATDAGVAKEVEEAARTKGFLLQIVKAASQTEIDAVFAALGEAHAGALLVSPDSFFTSRREQITALALRARIPTIYRDRQSVIAGGLISYGINIAAAYRQAGIYAGRILKGAKPADLAVQQPTEFELVINLKTAKALGLTVPPSILARADEVIE